MAIVKEENISARFKQSLKQHWAGADHGFADTQVQRRYRDFMAGWHANDGDRKRMDWLGSMCVEVRTPLAYGSRELFHAQDISDEEDSRHRTDLRQQVDAAMQPPKPSLS